MRVIIVECEADQLPLVLATMPRASVPAPVPVAKQVERPATTQPVKPIRRSWGRPLGAKPRPEVLQKAMVRAVKRGVSNEELEAVLKAYKVKSFRHVAAEHRRAVILELNKLRADQPEITADQVCKLFPGREEA